MKIGSVYKIICGQSNECYVGSTFDELRYRFKAHKSDYAKGKNKCSVVELFDKYGVENCRMILIKEYPVLDRKHIHVYETLWIKKLKAVNKHEPCGGLLKNQYNKQWNHANKEYYKIYYADNKEHIAERKRQYHEENKERIKQYKQQYHEQNKHRIQEKTKKWYVENKERVKKSQSEKVKCECGSEVAKGNISTHKKTQKHLNNSQ